MMSETGYLMNEDDELSEAKSRLVSILNEYFKCECEWGSSWEGAKHLERPERGVCAYATWNGLESLEVCLLGDYEDEAWYWKVPFDGFYEPIISGVVRRLTTSFPMRNTAEIMTVVTWLEQFLWLYSVMFSFWSQAEEIHQETIEVLASYVWCSAPGPEMFSGETGSRLY